jgi:NAD(P)-dependent dehydrogenase (short-subunit alcohol dehydrogenase family)
MTSVLITGANKGLGYETARRLGELGWRVFLGSRDKDRGTAAAQKLAADGAHVIMVPLDVTSQGKAVRLSRPESNVLEFQTTPGAVYVLSVSRTRESPRKTLR